MGELADRATTGVYTLNPLVDERWVDLVERHPRSSVFHSCGWLQALSRTYGYDPIALTTTERGPLANGLVVCRVRTCVSRRLVSSPFSDHCDVLVDDGNDLSSLLQFLVDESTQHRWMSIEVRPRGVTPHGLTAAASYCLHSVDLGRPAEDVFDGFHHSTQRAIRRAERERVMYEAGTSERLLAAFYGLLRQTRRRHGLPPQPLMWFQNLIESLRDTVTIHVASKDGQPIASIFTISFKKALFYKYGGSDARYHRFGAMPFLFWNAIQRAKQRGLEEMDLGRSDVNQAGLIAFKERLGGTRSTLTYYTWPASHHRSSLSGRFRPAVRWAVAHLPDAALDLTGRLLYRHVG